MRGPKAAETRKGPGARGQKVRVDELGETEIGSIRDKLLEMGLRIVDSSCFQRVYGVDEQALLDSGGCQYPRINGALLGNHAVRQAARQVGPGFTHDRAQQNNRKNPAESCRTPY